MMVSKIVNEDAWRARATVESYYEAADLLFDENGQRRKDQDATKALGLERLKAIQERQGSTDAAQENNTSHQAREYALVRLRTSDD